MEMESRALGDSVGPLAEAPDPVDPTVGADAARRARAMALMYADWGLAELPGAGPARGVARLGGVRHAPTPAECGAYLTCTVHWAQLVPEPEPFPLDLPMI